jgi:D-tyrosyl-tRNA(Tyr) deacylase
LQRVARASVRSGGERIAEIGPGLLVLLGIKVAEREGAAQRLAERCAGLRIFDDEQGKMNRSIRDVGGAVLVVSQFTLYADTSRGRRPGFEAAARPEEAEPLYRRFCEALEEQGVPTRRGRFGASMEVELVNDGPVTIVL